MNKIEKVLSVPFLAMGQLLDIVKRQTNNSRIFFIFPHYHTGGAEQVHVDIVRVFKSCSPWIIITRKSRNTSHLPALQECGKMFLEPMRHLNSANKFVLKNFLLGYWASLINRHQKAIVFGALSGFFYDLLPLLKRAHRIELIHALWGKKDVRQEQRRISLTKLIDTRVFISKHGMGEFKRLYTENNIDVKYFERYKLIYNAVTLNPQMPKKDYSSELKVVFIGRNSREKRFYLFEQVAQKVKCQSTKIRFFCIGDFKDADCVHSTNFGEILNRLEIYKMISDMHVLVLTSYREGLPLVILEAMACGLSIISTNVGGVCEAVEHGKNGFLVNTLKEDEIVNEIGKYIISLEADRKYLMELSNQSFNIVKDRFGYHRFSEEYINLFRSTGWQNDDIVRSPDVYV